MTPTDSSEPAIRRATLADGPPLAVLQRALGSFAILERESPAATRERVTRQLVRCLEDDSHAVYVAVDAKGGLLGYASMHVLPYLIHSGPEGYVSELFVVEAARGRRIGTRLLEVVEAHARDVGCSRLQLLNFRTRASYHRKFYEKAGWAERPEGASFVKLLG